MHERDIEAIRADERSRVREILQAGAMAGQYFAAVRLAFGSAISVEDARAHLRRLSEKDAPSARLRRERARIAARLATLQRQLAVAQALSAEVGITSPGVPVEVPERLVNEARQLAGAVRRLEERIANMSTGNLEEHNGQRP